MLNLFSKHVITNLLLRNLLPCYHLEIPDDSFDEDSFSSPRPKGLPTKNEFESVKSTIESFLTLLPAVQDIQVTYETYLSDAEQLISIAQQACGNWTSDDDLRPLNMQYFLFDEDENAPEYLTKFYGGGLFLSTLLDQLESMLDHSFSRNLLLTGIFTKLAQYPLAPLYTFLLDKSLPVKPGIRTLWTVLEAVNVVLFDFLIFRLQVKLKQKEKK
jgi:hypothetical protein